MKATVCQLPNDLDALETQWQALVGHVRRAESQLVLLPEMPFFSWLSHSPHADPSRWNAAVSAHIQWMERLTDLAPATIAGTRPVVRHHQRMNEAYLWDKAGGYQGVHTKYYLPDEAGFWEATWYQRGDGDFSLIDSACGRIGFLICTEIWFNTRARAYAKDGMQVLLCPRATPTGVDDKWLAGGRTAAVVSGAYCLSSNLAGQTKQGGEYGGTGWIIEPESGDVLGVTSEDAPFLTVDIDLAVADRAKLTYPRYVED